MAADDANIRSRKKILVVDDDPIALRSVTVPLQKKGYDVVTAESGEEAIDWLADHTADLVLLDMVMPGANGPDVCRALRAHTATLNTPVIFLTALRGLEEMAEAREAGSDLYLMKPVPPVRLLNMVDMFLSADVPLVRRAGVAAPPD